MRVPRRYRISALLAVGLVALPLACTPPTATGDIPNPDLTARCGLDLNLVIDRSGSVAAENETVARAAQQIIAALDGTPSRVRMASFSSTALVHPAGDPTGTPDLSGWTWEPVSDFEVPVLPSAGGTNIEGGLEVVRRAAGPVGDLTLLLTDGVPNERYLNSPDGHPGIFVGDGAALTEARNEANALKSAGSHILAVGIGEANETVLRTLSGPDEFAAGKPIEAADFLTVTSFGELTTAIGAVVRRLCGSTLSVTKLVMKTGRPVEPGGPGWRFDVSLVKDGIKQITDWSQPTRSFIETETLATEESGIATAAWVDHGQTHAEILEHPVAGFELAGFDCEADDFDGNGRQPVPVEVLGSGHLRVAVGGSVATYCRLINRELDGPIDPL